MPKTKNKYPWLEYREADELGGALHTALRKACDSKPTSAMWNLIYVCDNGWLWYLEQFFKRLQKAKTHDGVIDAAKRAASCTSMTASEAEYTKIPSEPEGIRHEVYSLICVLDLFDERDWEGFVAYLVE